MEGDNCVASASSSVSACLPMQNSDTQPVHGLPLVRVAAGDVSRQDRSREDQLTMAQAMFFGGGPPKEEGDSERHWCRPGYGKHRRDRAN